MEENKDNIEITETEEELKSMADELIAKLKALVKEGNVTRIRIRKDDRIILNLSMTVGLVGTLLGAVVAPWALILGAIGTVGLNCTVEVEKKDGTVTVIHGKA